MKNIVALNYRPPILEQIIVIGDQFITRYMDDWRAAAPRLFLYFGERVCNIV
jgi:hypothetical protein